MYEYFFQLGSGEGIDSFHQRDKEEVLNDPHSSIVAKPNDEESLVIIYIFNSASLEYNMGELSGFHYLSLKDSIRWTGLSVKKYVPILLNCMTKYIQGTNKSKN